MAGNIVDIRRGDVKDIRLYARMKEVQKEKEDETIERLLAFNKKPSEIKEYLDKYVIKQDIGKKALAVAVSFHYKKLSSILKDEKRKVNVDISKSLSKTRFVKRNMILIGPSGSGKTYSLDKLSELVNVPIVSEDLTKFTAAGYVGGKLEEIGTDLMTKAKGNKYLAMFGIVFLDEFDKIASISNTTGKDVNGLEVQNGLLKIVEGSDIQIPANMGGGSFSTKYNLFVAGGAFEGLKEYVEEQNANYIQENEHWSRYLSNSDFKTYGIETQLLGRFPIKVVYDSLGEPEIYQIIKESEDSPIKSYVEDFVAWGIDLGFEENALKLIANNAAKQKIGARGIITSIENVLGDHMFNLPGNYAGELVVTEDYVKSKIGDYNE